ncbi:type IX secretion system membrane protein, PorP/SprF family [Ekhidna lutea]|uniref:Type IX secretion system membrane protein, PorP/SprF family n=1 Tax=Ekhidna lutea TaxID=447679 RepID=A0A239I3Q4_EKHLU|nr:type IX secretion system membrane protein PorP/SprF [Ekhidna lutea]SNS86974.1 type IX secretion system membrane protein, PorP/SprF family [Ekhidna lutea]
MRQFFLLILFACVGQIVIAQQQAMFTQYMFNGLAINPAYAGSHESISATALARVQWVGIDGAPTTQTFSIHSPIPGRNIGLGAFIAHDKLGVTEQNTLYLSYAYMMQTGKGTLSFGLQGGLRSSSVNYSDLVVNDPNLQANQNEMSPNFGAGLFYSTDRFYAGASLPVIVNNEVGSNDNSDFSSKEIRHFFATAGYIFDLSPVLKLKPSGLIKSVSGAPIEMDVNANLIINDRVWFGLSYRSFDSIDFLFDLQINPQLRFGYAYDYTTSDLGQANSGSHEFMINYRFVFAKSKIVTPRYF